MSGASGKSFDKSHAPQAETPAKTDSARQPGGAHDAVLALQRLAGNRAVTELLGGSSGKALDPGTRIEMESKFGEDFSEVRIHDNDAAAASALAAGARAYTQGRDIVFGSGFYSPGSSSGKLLLAHELAHVVQQGRGPETTSQASAESSAREAAAQAAGGETATVAGPASGGAQADPMTEAERRRHDTELMAPPGLLSSIEAITGPSPQPAAPRKLSTVEIMEPGLAADLKKRGIGPQDPPKPAFRAKPAPVDKKQYPTVLRGDNGGAPSAGAAAHPEVENQSIEELEQSLFDPSNPGSRQNLATVIEGLGGKSFEPDKVSYSDLRKEYERLKGSSPAAAPPVNAPEANALDEPYLRRHRYIRTPVDDPLQYELKEVYGTPEEVEDMQADVDNQEAFSRGMQALAAGSGMREAQEANSAIGETIPEFRPMVGGAPVETTFSATPAPVFEPAGTLERGEINEGVSTAPRAPLPDESVIHLDNGVALNTGAGLGAGAGPAIEEPGAVKPGVSVLDPDALDQSEEGQFHPKNFVEVDFGLHAANDTSVQDFLGTRMKPANDVEDFQQALFSRKAELSAASQIASENQGQAVDLNKVGKSNFAGVDIVSKREIASVKAYSGDTAMERYDRDLQEISGGIGYEGAASKVSKTVADMERLQAQSEAQGVDLPLPPDYAADPAAYIEQNTVMRVPDDHVEEFKQRVIDNLTNPSSRYGPDRYGLNQTPTLEEAQKFADRRIKGVGMSTTDLYK